MSLFLQTALSFPVVLFSFLLCLAIVYWLSVAMGVLEVDLLDIDMNSAFEAEVGPPEGLAGLFNKWGLNGIPLTLILTLLFFFAWLVSYYAELVLLSALPLGLLRYPVGLLVASASVLISVPVIALLIRTLRPLFRKVGPTTHRSLLGQCVKVRTAKVTAAFGEATLEDGGAGLILHIRADEALGFKRGDLLVLIEYMENQNAYRVVSEQAFKGL